MQCMCVLGVRGEEAFFFNNKDIPASRYRDLGASPSRLRVMDESITSASCGREQVLVQLLWYAYSWQGEAV